MSALTLAPIDLAQLRDTFCFGVAGNFTGHLEQAGEAVDFEQVATSSEELPKGIFPWYAPGASTFLGQFPLSSHTLTVPSPTDGTPLRIQIEPELGLLCDVVRNERGVVASLIPRWVAAFDDCSLRRPNAAKISHKKNWGSGSKGLAPRAFEVSRLDRDGPARSLRLACFLQRDGHTHRYGVDSAVPSYTLFGEELLAWLVDRLENQREAPGTPLEDVGELLGAGGDARPTRVLVGVGATRYESFGETTFVRPGDEAIVVLYDSDVHEPSEVARVIALQADADLVAASVLRRAARPVDAAEA